MTAKEVAQAFVSAINKHDLELLASLMTDDHVFVDGLGTRVSGKEAMLAGWRAYFAMVPDYRVDIETVIEGDGMVAMFGTASGTYAPESLIDPAKRWKTPAAWLAEVRGGKVAAWSVFADNLPMRRLMSIEPA